MTTLKQSGRLTACYVYIVTTRNTLPAPKNIVYSSKRQNIDKYATFTVFCLYVVWITTVVQLAQFFILQKQPPSAVLLTRPLQPFFTSTTPDLTIITIIDLKFPISPSTQCMQSRKSVAKMPKDLPLKYTFIKLHQRIGIDLATPPPALRLLAYSPRQRHVVHSSRRCRANADEVTPAKRSNQLHRFITTAGKW